ncbi:MAG TPA: dipeptidase [Bacteroidales bacterium]|nr:dipeptidase [Bacteroidales bacterium]
MKRLFKALFAFTVAGIFAGQTSTACTNYIVTRGASKTGSVMITYSADSHVLYGELYYWPSRDYPDGAWLDVYEWDTGKYMGKIKQVRHTYSVVGNMNEHQLSIGETTYGGIEGLVDPDAIVDYGSLIYITLQRAKNAREAIKVMSELVSEYGYASSGESFSIADPNEAWIFEIIGKGKGNKGAVWVARLIPDGYVSGHANQARIQTFPLATGKKTGIALTSKDLGRIFDPVVECVYAHDVISFARTLKNPFTGTDQQFSFSDTYNPISFDGARFCEMRVWSFFKSVSNGMDQYKNYVSGHDLSKRMPLWIKPDRKISNYDLMNFMRDHLEGTEFDMRKDIGAGPFGSPYRWRPLTWKVSDDPNAPSYCNERATATQQTGFVFVAESRNWLPDPVGGIFWFGVDDAATTVFNPMYCGITEIPECFRAGNGDMVTYSPTSAFWLFNQVANMCYSRYDLMSADAVKLQNELESKYIAETAATDEAARKLYENDVWKARDYLTKYSVATAQSTFMNWKKLSEYLLVKYIDGNIKNEKDGKFATSPDGYPSGPRQPGYDDKWKKSVIQDTGNKLLVPGGPSH